MYHANTLTHITDGLPQLRYLHINNAFRFVELSGIPSLEDLNLYGVPHFTTLRDIDNLKSVRIDCSHKFTSIELSRNIPCVEFHLLTDISCLTNVCDALKLALQYEYWKLIALHPQLLLSVQYGYERINS
eukprot:gene8910-9647_t